MGEQGIPSDIKAFILERIDSVVQVEILLLVFRSPQKSFAPDDVGKEFAHRFGLG